MDFHKTHSIEIRFVVGPENKLFAGVSGNLTGWGSEWVN